MARLLAVAVAATGCILRTKAGGELSETAKAIVNVRSPAALENADLQYFASFSGPPPDGELLAWAPGEGNEEGCQALPPAPGAQRVAFLWRGTCAFTEKARHAQEAGAAGLVVVSDSNYTLSMTGNKSDELGLNIFVVGLPMKEGQAIIDWTRKHPEDPVRLSVGVYDPPLWDASLVALLLMAPTLVVLGAFFATADMRVGSPLAPKSREEVVDVGADLAVCFCVMGSCMLMVLFFFMHYMIYVIIFAFCTGGFSVISQMGAALLTWMVPTLNKRKCSLPEIGPITTADMLSWIPAAALVGSWVVLRNTPHGWIFQDIIGAGFLCWMQRTLRLPDVRVATCLLSAMFFFDIYWVFISPLMFHGKSVMVEVARGGGTGESIPMLLKMPAFNDPFGNERMLGFGDIAVPGLLVSYLRRHDLKSGKSGCSGYFVPAVVGYFIGLCCTMFALTIMRMGQPALLYLVPGTLGTTLVLGLCRGEFWDLWTGTPTRSTEEEEALSHEGGQESAESSP